jgi:hypothetical protein
MNDELLNKYRHEMTNERNDGWWKKHYEELYKKRIEEIKKEKEQKETNSND